MRGKALNGDRRTSTAGQALVETALVLPLLLLLFMGAVDVGRLLFMQISLEEAVHEGATYAAQATTPTGTFHARVTQRIQTSSNHGEVTTATVAAPVCTAAKVNVSASAPVALLTPLGSVLFGGSITLTSTVVSTNLDPEGDC